MHLHASLINKAGKNLFAGDPMSPLFRHAIGGLQASMCDFMAVWAQSANAYRRHVPKAYVPMAAHWGFNNRNVALRIPRTSERRDAHRAPRRQRRRQSVPRACRYPCRNSAWHHEQGRTGPDGRRQRQWLRGAATARRVWFNALERFRHSNVVRDTFGAPFQDVYFKLKQTERNNFERIVTSLDHEWYAHVA